MKRLIISALLLLPLLFAVQCRAAAPTIANSGGQHCAAVVVGSNAVNCSLPNNVTAGNMIVVFVSYCSTSQGETINTPTMTGETFTKVTGASIDGSNGAVITYTTNSAAGGQKQVSATFVGSCDARLHVVEVTGQAASPIDATGNTESTTMSVSTSGSTTSATDLVLVMFFDNATNNALSCTAPYTLIDTTNGGAGTSLGIDCQNTTSSTGTQTATGTGNSGNTIEQSIIAIQPPAGGGVTGTIVLGKSTIVGNTKVM